MFTVEVKKLNVNKTLWDKQRFKMPFLKHFVTCVLLTVSVCQAETGGLRAATGKGVTLQPWLIGLAAVAGFLFIVFILLIVQRLYFKEDVREEEDGFFENIMEAEEEMADIKQTSM